MAHVGTDGNHADICVCEHLAAIPHDRLLLSSKDQRVKSLVLANERVACNLVIADVSTQLNEAFFFRRKTKESIIVFNLHVELLACVHRELIDHDLTEEAVIDVSLPRGLQPSVSNSLAEVTVGNASARVQH